MDSYEEKREKLLKSVECKTMAILSDDEKKCDAKISKLRAQFIEECDGNVPYNVDTLNDKRIENSELFKVLRKLPKGADLHVHGLCLMPAKEFVDYLLTNDDVTVCTQGEDRGKLFCGPDKSTYPEGCMTVKEIIDNNVMTHEELEVLWTLRGCPADMRAWDYFEIMFLWHGGQDESMSVYEEYYYASFKYYISQNIYHVEPRTLLFGSHEVAVTKAEAIRNAYYRVKKECPDFSCMLVGASLKAKVLPAELTDMLIENALYAKEQVKDESDPAHVSDFIAGFDLVNEEDISKPLCELTEAVKKGMANHPEGRVFLHAGESLIPESNNIIDAYLLGAERIGHGFNLYRYPALIDNLKADDVCLEVCPVSNRTLGYIEDLRLHPAVEYIKRGVPVAICSDDPGYQEIATLTDDFFAVVLCWGFGLAQIKQLIINSIEYSSLDSVKKHQLRLAWNREWEKFIKENAD